MIANLDRYSTRSIPLAGRSRTGDVPESSGIFFWKPGTVAERVPFRQSQSEIRRALSDICLAELVDFVLLNPAALEEPDAPLVYARLLELERLAASSRARLEEAINRASALATA